MFKKGQPNAGQADRPTDAQTKQLTDRQKSTQNRKNILNVTVLFIIFLV